MRCEDCYFWHKEASFCCLKSQMNADECSDAIWNLEWDEEQQEAVERRRSG